MGSIRKLCALLLIALAVSANAQLTRWRLGGPALILDMPGDPGAGGVKWHEASVYNFLPTSWSADSPDATLEVSSSIKSLDNDKRIQTLATSLGDKVGTTTSSKVSGCPSVYFSIGSRSGVIIQDDYKQWIVLGTPKTQAGNAIIAQCIQSISVERGGTPRWVRRNVGQTKMNAPLPYELSLEAPKGDSDRRNSYELFFDGFEVTSFVETPGEGMKFELAKTLNEYVNGEKAIAGTEDFKSKRTRIKGNGYTGEQFDLEFRRKNKDYFIKTLFIGDDKRVARVSMVGNQGNDKHIEYAQRIFDGLKVSDANFDGLEPRQAGDEGIWIDFPKDLTKDSAGGTSFRQYGCFIGNYAVDVRITDKTPGIGDNQEQLIDFIEAKFKGQIKDAKDMDTDRSRTTVNGLDARTLKINYKSKGVGTLRYAMAIFGPDKNYVIELIGYESQKDLFERIFDTASVKVAASPSWRMTPVGEGGISMLAPPSFKADKGPADEEGADSIISGIVNEDGVIALITEIRYKTGAPMPGAMLNRMAKTLFGVLKVDYEVAEQRPFEVGSSQGLRAFMKAKQGGKEIPADMIILRRGKYLWVMVVLSNPGIKQAVVNHYSIINSIQ